ncbi:Serine/threonine-protein kinase H1 [Elasticomyces elasticus]|nr:Serine/threonine-protein kinase H1 [Elasticomyces elasticus]KAK3644544.1 Serine/threonine-protein kinase H1 [Elasticomyces elasticus]KAK4910396.1 Serine/threonine-protein kinase H1 [Elasticomyces elasticus]KAK5750061.1 Serine/threonine-protein kinase H1 [Elasticomyces elasticus]
MDTFELVRLAKLDATLSEDLQYTRHTYAVARTGHRAVIKEAVWKRTAKPLGAGSFGEVYREECTEGQSVGELRAVKCILKPTYEIARKVNYANELQTVARFSQPQYEQHFVKSFGWYETNEAVLIAMEFVELGDLQSYLRSPFSERDTQQIILQVLRGLTFMHAAGYAHRDLKPANLLVFSSGPQWHVKIADFGLSKRVLTDLTALRTNAGTQGFMAPEMLGLGFGEDDSSDEDSQQSYTNAVDIWAVGVIAYLLLTGMMPFSPSEPRALGRYARGKTPFPTQALAANKVGQEAQKMIRSLVASKPSERPTSDASTRHIWLSMSVPSEGSTTVSESSMTVQDVPSAQWTAESQDSGYQGQNTILTVDTHNMNTTQHPEDRTKRPASTDSEGDSTLVDPKIALRTRAILSRPSELPAVPGQHEGAREVNDGGNIGSVAHMGRGSYWKPYEITTITHQTHQWTEMAFSGDGQLMATALGDDEGGITIWDVATSEQPIPITTLDHSPAYSLRFSQNGQRFAFASKCTLMVYDLRKLSKMVRVDSIELAITSDEPATRTMQLALSPDGQVLVYPSESAGLKLRILSQTSGDRTLELPAYRRKRRSRRRLIKNVVFSPDSRLICAYSYSESTRNLNLEVELLLWDAASCQLKNRMTLSVERVTFGNGLLSIAFSPDSQLVALGHGTRTTLVSVATLQIVKTLGNNTTYERVYSLAFRPDGGLMAVVIKDAQSAAFTWDLSTGTSAVCPLEAEYYLKSATISSDGMKIATIGPDSSKLWRLKENE